MNKAVFDCAFNMNSTICCGRVRTIRKSGDLQIKCRSECGETDRRRAIVLPPHSPGLAIVRDSLFRVGAELENRHTRLHEGQVIATGSQKAKMDQFNASFPYAFFQGEAYSPSLNIQRLEAAAAAPTRGSRLGAVRGVDQSQARLHIDLHCERELPSSSRMPSLMDSRPGRLLH